MIRKTYFYGAGEAGVEENITWDDFAQYHIQDEEVAIDVARNVLEFGESENIDLHANVVEIYDTDTPSDLRIELEEAVERLEREYGAA